MNENEKGLESKRLLESPLTKEFFEETEKKLFNEWRNADFMKEGAMQKNIDHLRNLQSFKTMLENYANEWERKRKEEQRHKYFEDNNPLI